MWWARAPLQVLKVPSCHRLQPGTSVPTRFVHSSQVYLAGKARTDNGKLLKNLRELAFSKAGRQGLGEDDVEEVRVGVHLRMPPTPTPPPPRLRSPHIHSRQPACAASLLT
jgi:hypothetical protein